MGHVLKAENINKHFTDPVDFHVLKDISFEVEKGEFVSIMGKSGCGKSTLLYILSTMDTDYTGNLYLDGDKLTGQTADQLSRVRNEHIGFVFQFHYLLPEFTVLENVMLPARKLAKKSDEEIREDALREAIGLKLKQLRETAGITQAELADLIGSDQPEVSRLEERENLLLSTLQDYLHALGSGVDGTVVVRRNILKNLLLLTL